MSVRGRLTSWLDETDTDRRVLTLLLVVLLVLLGGGIGTFLPNLGLGGQPQTAGPTAPSTVATGTPSPVPTPADGGASSQSTGDDAATATPGTSTSEPPDDTATATVGEATPERSDDADTATPDEPSTETPDDDGGDGGTGGTATSTPDGSDGLLVTTDRQVVAVEEALPGGSGRGTVTIENAGDEPGEVRIADVVVRDHENGITEPESAVDDSPGEGEISDALGVRLAFVNGMGYPDYALGTAGYEPLSTLPDRVPSEGTSIGPGERLALAVDWRLPASTGNELQSDGVEFDVVLAWEATDGDVETVEVPLTA